MRREFKVPVNLVNLASDPATGVEGDIYYNTTDDVVRLYANGSWTTIGAGGGGGSSDSFKTISISGQSDVVADSSTDTLTLINGTNITMTTNATNDSITINSTGNFTSVDSIVYPDYITFDTTPETVPSAAGSIYWDSGESAPGLILNANVDLKVGQENVVLVANQTGSTIAKGKVVYINGAQGQRPTIALSDADTEATSSKTLGLTAESIATGAEGFVTTFGVLRGVDTFGLTEGAMLWLSSTAGGYTTTAPTEPAHAVFLGYVVKAHASSGEIFVNVQNGYELTELHDVSITGVVADNEVLAYDNTSSQWINQTPTEAGLVAGVGTNKISYQTTAPSSPATGDIWIDSDATSTGTNLDALSDVNITSNTIGEVLAWDGTNWINETPEEIGTHLGFRGGFYYATAASNTQANASNTQAVFTPFFVPKRTTFDRIACRTGTGFSGSGVVRLGIYTNLDGQPDSLILDSGQLSCTTAGQVFEATINTTLDPGVYWLCFVSQTAATTNQYRASLTGYFFGGPQYGNTSAGGGQNVGWVITSGFTGALPATAGTPTVSGTCQTVWLRKA